MASHSRRKWWRYSSGVLVLQRLGVDGADQRQAVVFVLNACQSAEQAGQALGDAVRFTWRAMPAEHRVKTLALREPVRAGAALAGPRG
jgi:hypothetical protein